ncbi:M61 family metallopeptidase [Spongiimicrobium salis]|uniref:M61 family metallopeptidase n=1 Tax=Spongiimicrobium salis TaxID=1667022 RepID=UPI00374D6874
MRTLISLCFVLAGTVFLHSQSTSYEISFDNAVHHEAEVKASFHGLSKRKTASFRMSRTSPGRYALHEFAKNVYGVKATDGKGNELKITRPNPYQWDVKGHDGTVHMKYTLFANRGGGTYAQIDETHAHLNIPATFMFAPALKNNPIQVTFKTREDLGWKIATQLKPLQNNTYTAPNLDYFMDSPTEISNFSIREFQETSNGKSYNIRFVLLHEGTEAELDDYFEQVKAIVKQEKAVYGELPDFDYGEYTFLACYMPNASGDGMEHRNSTILTSTRSLANGGMRSNIGTVSHEFFHAWNVERIRPKSLEPFDYEAANMSGELWFAEGFTSYYTGLILCRANIRTPKEYVEGLTGTFNYVWNSPARQFFNPIEMSYQAPFVDAATSVDPVNRENTFISYYSYGSVLGLALDLSLREQNLNLDDYMKLIWNTYGKTEIPYTISNLHEALNKYAGKSFGDRFFDQYIYNSNMPNYASLFDQVGVSLQRNDDKVAFGARVNDAGTIQNNPSIGSPAYLAGMDKGDHIVFVDNKAVDQKTSFSSLLENYAPGDQIKVTFNRFGNQKSTIVTLSKDPRYRIGFVEKPSEAALRKRKAWLAPK